MDKLEYTCYGEDKEVIGRLSIEFINDETRDEIVRSLLRSLKFSLATLDQFISVEETDTRE